MQCPECGSELTGSPTMCPACGAPLAGGTTSEKVKHAGFFSRHLERVLLVGGVLLIVVLMLLAVHFKWDNPLAYVSKPLDHANWLTGVLLAVIVASLVTTIVTAQRGRLPFIRRIPGLNAIDEAVGRATEMGRPILFSSGLADLDIIGLQSLAVAGQISRHAARYGTRFIYPVYSPQMMPIAEQVLREAYAAEGHPEAYRPEDVRYLSSRQFAYAAGVTSILHRERPAASFLFGYFFAEALILAENGQAVGAIQVAGTPDLTQIPFFVVTCDYTIIGDEYYAATAYLSREPTLLGSLVGQDLGKIMLLVLILVGTIWTAFTPNHTLLAWLGGSFTDMGAKPATQQVTKPPKTTPAPLTNPAPVAAIPVATPAQVVTWPAATLAGSVGNLTENPDAVTFTLDGKTILVGSQDAVTALHLSLKNGEQASVTGWEAAHDGRAALITGAITVGEKTYTVRDKMAVPVWNVEQRSVSD